MGGVTGGDTAGLLAPVTDILGGVGLLDPISGQGGLLPVTTPVNDGKQAVLDPVVGPDGLLPLTSGTAGNNNPLGGLLNGLLGL